MSNNTGSKLVTLAALAALKTVVPNNIEAANLLTTALIAHAKGNDAAIEEALVALQEIDADLTAQEDGTAVSRFA